MTPVNQDAWVSQLNIKLTRETLLIPQLIILVLAICPSAPLLMVLDFFFMCTKDCLAQSSFAVSTWVNGLA